MALPPLKNLLRCPCKLNQMARNDTSRFLKICFIFRNCFNNSVYLFVFYMQIWL